jgi:hypothetical protein
MDEGTAPAKLLEAQAEAVGVGRPVRQPRGLGHFPV